MRDVGVVRAPYAGRKRSLVKWRALVLRRARARPIGANSLMAYFVSQYVLRTVQPYIDARESKRVAENGR